VRTLARTCLFLILGAALVGMPAMASPRSPVSAPLGMILQAENAQVGADITSGGATIYDGDRLATESGGALRAQLGGPQMYLRGSTVALVHGLPNGFSAELGTGTVVISSAEGQTFQLLADGATIRPVGTQATIAQITRVNDNQVLLTSTRGALQVTLDDQVQTIEAGSSYRMEIEAEDSGPGPQGQGPAHTGRRRRALFFLLFGGVAVATGILIWRATVSPSGF
jgi:hypothetical protein